MKIPLGSLLKGNLAIERVDFHKLIQTLAEHNFTGYLVMDLMTNNGMEEGILLFKDGDAVASEYLYLARSQSLTGRSALREVMNACASMGVFDIYSLSQEEVLSSRASGGWLDHKATLNELLEMIPERFEERIIEEPRPGERVSTIPKPAGLTREEILKKYGISAPDEKMLDKLLRDVTDGAS